MADFTQWEMFPTWGVIFIVCVNLKFVLDYFWSIYDDFFLQLCVHKHYVVTHSTKLFLTYVKSDTRKVLSMFNSTQPEFPLSNSNSQCKYNVEDFFGILPSFVSDIEVVADMINLVHLIEDDSAHFDCTLEEAAFPDLFALCVRNVSLHFYYRETSPTSFVNKGITGVENNLSDFSNLFHEFEAHEGGLGRRRDSIDGDREREMDGDRDGDGDGDRERSGRKTSFSNIVNACKSIAPSKKKIMFLFNSVISFDYTGMSENGKYLHYLHTSNSVMYHSLSVLLYHLLILAGKLPGGRKGNDNLARFTQWQNERKEWLKADICSLEDQYHLHEEFAGFIDKFCQHSNSNPYREKYTGDERDSESKPFMSSTTTSSPSSHNSRFHNSAKHWANKAKAASFLGPLFTITASFLKRKNAHLFDFSQQSYPFDPLGRTDVRETFLRLNVRCNIATRKCDCLTDFELDDSSAMLLLQSLARMSGGFVQRRQDFTNAPASSAGDSAAKWFDGFDVVLGLSCDPRHLPFDTVDLSSFRKSNMERDSFPGQKIHMTSSEAESRDDSLDEVANRKTSLDNLNDVDSSIGIHLNKQNEAFSDGDSQGSEPFTPRSNPYKNLKLRDKRHARSWNKSCRLGDESLKQSEIPGNTPPFRKNTDRPSKNNEFLSNDMDAEHGNSHPIRMFVLTDDEIISSFAQSIANSCGVRDFVKIHGIHNQTLLREMIKEDYISVSFLNSPALCKKLRQSGYRGVLVLVSGALEVVSEEVLGITDIVVVFPCFNTQRLRLIGMLNSLYEEDGNRLRSHDRHFQDHIEFNGGSKNNVRKFSTSSEDSFVSNASDTEGTSGILLDTYSKLDSEYFSDSLRKRRLEKAPFHEMKVYTFQSFPANALRAIHCMKLVLIKIFFAALRLIKHFFLILNRYSFKLLEDSIRYENADEDQKDVLPHKFIQTKYGLYYTGLTKIDHDNAHDSTFVDQPTQGYFVEKRHAAKCHIPMNRSTVDGILEALDHYLAKYNKAFRRLQRFIRGESDDFEYNQFYPLHSKNHECAYRKYSSILHIYKFAHYSQPGLTKAYQFQRDVEIDYQAWRHKSTSKMVPSVQSEFTIRGSHSIRLLSKAIPGLVVIYFVVTIYSSGGYGKQINADHPLCEVCQRICEVFNNRRFVGISKGQFGCVLALIYQVMMKIWVMRELNGSSSAYIQEVRHCYIDVALFAAAFIVTSITDDATYSDKSALDGYGYLPFEIDAQVIDKIPTRELNYIVINYVARIFTYIWLAISTFWICVSFLVNNVAAPLLVGVVIFTVYYTNSFIGEFYMLFRYVIPDIVDDDMRLHNTVVLFSVVYCVLLYSTLAKRRADSVVYQAIMIHGRSTKLLKQMTRAYSHDTVSHFTNITQRYEEAALRTINLITDQYVSWPHTSDPPGIPHEILCSCIGVSMIRYILKGMKLQEALMRKSVAKKIEGLQDDTNDSLHEMNAILLHPSILRWIEKLPWTSPGVYTTIEVDPSLCCVRINDVVLHVCIMTAFLNAMSNIIVSRRLDQSLNAEVQKIRIVIRPDVDYNDDALNCQENSPASSFLTKKRLIVEVIDTAMAYDVLNAKNRDDNHDIASYPKKMSNGESVLNLREPSSETEKGSNRIPSTFHSRIKDQWSEIQNHGKLLPKPNETSSQTEQALFISELLHNAVVGTENNTTCRVSTIEALASYIENYIWSEFNTHLLAIMFFKNLFHDLVSVLDESHIFTAENWHFHGKPCGTRQVFSLPYQVVPLSNRLVNSKTPQVYMNFLTNFKTIGDKHKNDKERITSWLSSFMVLDGSNRIRHYSSYQKHLLNCIVVLPDDNHIYSQYHEKFKLELYKHGWKSTLIVQSDFLAGNVHHISVLSEADCVFVPLKDHKVNSILYLLRAGGLKSTVIGIDFSGQQSDKSRYFTQDDDLYARKLSARGSIAASTQQGAFHNSFQTLSEHRSQRNKSRSISVNEFDYSYSFLASTLSQSLLNAIAELVIKEKFQHIFSMID